MTQRGQQSLQMSFVVIRQVLERNAHAEIRIVDGYLAIRLDPLAIGFQLQMKLGSGRIGGLSFDVAAVKADVGEGGPCPDFAPFFADLRAAFALVAGTAALLGTAELISRCGVRRDWMTY